MEHSDRLISLKVHWLRLYQMPYWYLKRHRRSYLKLTDSSRGINTKCMSCIEITTKVLGTINPLDGISACVCAIQRSYSRHQTLITAVQSESKSTSTNKSPLTSDVQVNVLNWDLLIERRRAPAPSQCTLWMLELRLPRNTLEKRYLKVTMRRLRSVC